MQKFNSPYKIAKLTNGLRWTLQHQTICKRRCAALSVAADKNKASPNEMCSWEAAKPFEEIPSDLMVPFIGTAWTLMPIVGRYKNNRLHLSFLDKLKRLGPIYRDKFGSLNMVATFSCEDIKTILNAEGPYPERPEMSTIKVYRESRKQWYNSTGLIALQGKEWADLRQKVQKHVLRPKAIQAYLGSMQSVARDLAHKIYDLRDANKEVPDLLRELYKWSLESVCLVGLDTRLGCLQKDLPPDSDGLKMIQSINTKFECMNKLEAFTGNLPFWKFFPSPTWKKFEKAADTFAEIAFKYLNKAVDDLKYEAEKGGQLTLLQNMLAKKDLNVSDAMVFVADLMMAGIETTSYSGGYLLYNLARNPSKQEILHQEIVKLLPSEKVKLNPEIFESLKYTRACLKESQRMTPVVGGNARVIAYDCVLSGYQVPAGTFVVMPNLENYQNEKYFKNAKEFLPERWLNKDEKPHPYSFLPFGFGPRSCIGKRLAETELVAFATEVIRNFRVEYHHEDIGYYTQMVNVPDKPLRFNFIER